MEKFKCLSCGSFELSFVKWVKCVEKVVVHKNNHIEYYDQQIDVKDMLRAEYRYICACCGRPPMLYGTSIMTEDDLLEYLDMTVDERAAMQAEYEQMQLEQANPEEITE